MYKEWWILYLTWRTLAILPAAAVTVDPSPPERLRPEDDLGWAARILEAEEEELLMMTWRRPATSSPRQRTAESLSPTTCVHGHTPAIIFIHSEREAACCWLVSIKHDEFCIKHDGLCIKMMDSVFKWWVLYYNDELCIKDDGFCT